LERFFWPHIYGEESKTPGAGITGKSHGNTKFNDKANKYMHSLTRQLAAINTFAICHGGYKDSIRSSNI
tara:strand:+ start:2377 stop:2583 length:207 start_codon:yes stop_codon:yes gene_type:complete